MSEQKPPMPKPGLPPEGIEKKEDMLNRNVPLTPKIEADRQTAHPGMGDMGQLGAPSKEDTEVEAGEIPVVALRHGFYDQQRREPGDKFFIRDMDELGSWMALADAKKEKSRRDGEEKRKKDAQKKRLKKQMDDLGADDEE